MAGLTDEEMAALEASEKAKTSKGLTDEEMAALEAKEAAAPKPNQPPAEPPSWLDTAGSLLKSGGETALKVGGKALMYGANPVGTALALTDMSPQGLGGAVLHGGGKGLTGGFIDELEGARGAFAEARRPLAKLTGTEYLEGLSPEPQSLADAYRRARDQRRRDDESARRAHPEEFMGSELAGGILSSSAMPVAKAGAAARIAQAGGIGGVFGAGNSEASDAAGLAKDTGVGILLGATTQGVLGEAPRALASKNLGLADYFRGKAGENAVKAVGGRASNLEKLGRRIEDAPEFGNQLLDKGLVPTGLNPLRNPLKQTAARAKRLAQQTGAEIGEAEQSFDAGRPFGPLGEGVERMDYARVARDADRRLSGITASEERAGGKARDLVADVRRQQEITPGSMQGLQDLKRSAYDSVNFVPEAKNAPRLHREVANSITGSIQDQFGEQMGQQALSKLRAANEGYSLAKAAGTLSEKALKEGPKQNPQRTMLATALGAAVGSPGGMVGSGAGATLGAMLERSLSTRGPNVAAHFNRVAEQGTRAASDIAATSQLPATSVQRLLQEAQNDPDVMAKLKAFFGGS